MTNREILRPTQTDSRTAPDAARREFVRRLAALTVVAAPVVASLTVDVPKAMAY